MNSQRISNGVLDLASAFMGGKGARSDGALSAAKEAHQYALTEKEQANAEIQMDKLRGRRSLSDHFDPNVVSAARAADTLKGSDVADLVGAFQNQGRISKAVDTYPQDPSLANFMLQASGEDAYTPYSQAANGQILNEATGSYDASSPIATSTTFKNNAAGQASQASAANYQNQVVDRDRRYSFDTGPKFEHDQAIDWVKANAAADGKLGTNITTNMAPPVPEYSKLDKGYVYARNPDGSIKINEKGVPTVVPIEGSAAEAELFKIEEAAKNKSDMQQTYGSVVTEDIARASDLIDKGGVRLPVTGFGSGASSSISGTDAHQLSQFLSTIKANAGFDKLQAMRDSSPTGGALGQVTEKELGFLQAAIGSLEQSQSSDELKYNLERVNKLYNEIVHGAQDVKDPTMDPLGLR